MTKLTTLFAALAISGSIQAAEWSGNVAIESRYFLHEPLPQNTEQEQHYLSLSAEPEFYHSWDDDSQSLSFKPFIRIDQYDDERSHGDIRELVWQQVLDDWELKAGISKVYWGVTESQHLVDVINQTDNVENIDGEDKLGQAMIQASFERDWGIIDVFLLPGFRERSFPDEQGRPRSLPYVDANQSQYESSDKDRHIDFALRWFHMIDDWEIGLSYFKGTSREPILLLDTGNILVPFYPQMTQFGIDAQATTEDWLWKFEAIYRDWLDDDFLALTAGIEYSLVGILDSDADLGIVLEYLYDDRDSAATSLFENDVMMGLRLALNDEQSSEALLGLITDANTQESMISLEASTRLGDNWTLEVEVRSYQHVKNSGFLQALSKDDLMQIQLSRFF